MENEIYLYQAETVLTFEKYLAYSKIINKVRFKEYNVWLMGLSVLLLATAFLRKEYIFILVCLTYIILLSIITIAVQKYKAKRYYKQTKIIQNKKINFLFAQDFFVVTANNSESKINYNDIYRLVITKDSFYLMINARQAYIFEKHPNDNDLIKFLMEKSNQFTARKHKVISFK